MNMEKLFESVLRESSRGEPFGGTGNFIVAYTCYGETGAEAKHFGSIEEIYDEYGNSSEEEWYGVVPAAAVKRGDEIVCNNRSSLAPNINNRDVGIAFQGGEMYGETDKISFGPDFTFAGRAIPDEDQPITKITRKA